MQTFRHRFTASLTQRDVKQHIPYPVVVPPGTRSLRVRLAYNPQVVDAISNLLTLTIFDPDGFRGAAHRSGSVLDVTIQENAAAPGFFPGPVRPGEWIIQVDTHMIMPGLPLALELEVSGSDEPDAALAPPAMPARRSPGQLRGPGWYRGDLHAHTDHSDGSWDVAGLLAFARANRLDFVTLSDHNTVTGLPELEAACPHDLLPIFGSELTTFWGHALALGRREWVDWRITPGVREMSAIAAEVEAQGGLFVIAHPEAVGDPYCTGCLWGFDDVRPGPARVVEVWNSPWESESNNEEGLRLALNWMQSGLRMVLTAGTDRHGEPYAAPESAFNIVYAQELSEQGILTAIRAGHLYLTGGPALDFTARVGARSLMVGDSAQAFPGETVALSVHWEGCPGGARIELVVDGELHSVQKAGAAGNAAWQLSGGEVAWALVCVRAEDCAMLALSNPIYFDGR